jgi:hypothetical protein
VSGPSTQQAPLPKLSKIPPRFTIELGLEASPRIYLLSQNDGEEARLADWISSNDELAGLLKHAMDVGDAWQRRRVA